MDPIARTMIELAERLGKARVKISILAEDKAKLQDIVADQEEVLEKAVEVIMQWHGGLEEAWLIYYNLAPEMAPIREILGPMASIEDKPIKVKVKINANEETETATKPMRPGAARICATEVKVDIDEVTGEIRTDEEVKAERKRRLMEGEGLDDGEAETVVKAERETRAREINEQGMLIIAHEERIEELKHDLRASENRLDSWKKAFRAVELPLAEQRVEIGLCKDLVASLEGHLKLKDEAIALQRKELEVSENKIDRLTEWHGNQKKTIEQMFRAGSSVREELKKWEDEIDKLKTFNDNQAESIDVLQKSGDRLALEVVQYKSINNDLIKANKAKDLYAEELTKRMDTAEFTVLGRNEEIGRLKKMSEVRLEKVHEQVDELNLLRDENEGLRERRGTGEVRVVDDEGEMSRWTVSKRFIRVNQPKGELYESDQESGLYVLCTRLTPGEVVDAEFDPTEDEEDEEDAGQEEAAAAREAEQEIESR